MLLIRLNYKGNLTVVEKRSIKCWQMTVQFPWSPRSFWRQWKFVLQWWWQNGFLSGISSVGGGLVIFPIFQLIKCHWINTKNSMQSWIQKLSYICQSQKKRHKTIGFSSYIIVRENEKSRRERAFSKQETNFSCGILTSFLIVGLNLWFIVVSLVVVNTKCPFKSLFDQ